MTLAERLRTETRPHHLRAEEAMGLVSAELSAARYVEILQAFHGFYSSLQPQLKGFHEWKEIGCDIESRLGKLSKVEDDLEFFNARARSATARVAIESFAEALGAMYVIEGSTLGGQVISKFLAERFGYLPDSGASYFSGYGSETGKMWVAFKGALARAESFSVDQDRVVEGAAQTFDFLTQLLYIPRNQAVANP